MLIDCFCFLFSVCFSFLFVISVSGRFIWVACQGVTAFFRSLPFSYSFDHLSDGNSKRNETTRTVRDALWFFRARSGIRSVSILLSFISPLPRMLRTSSSLFLLVVDFVILFIYAKAIIARGKKKKVKRKWLPICSDFVQLFWVVMCLVGNFLSLGTLAAAVEPMYTLYLFISFYIIRRRIL